jgi:hypothetical protein
MHPAAQQTAGAMLAKEVASHGEATSFYVRFGV